MAIRISSLIALGVILIVCFLVAATTKVEPRPGKMTDGRMLLPNGWIISPVGRAVELDVGSLTMAQSKDGQTVAVLNCGASRHSVSILDVASEKVLETVPVQHAWIGIAFHPSQKRVFVSGGTTGQVWDIPLRGGGEKRPPISLGAKVFVTGVAVSPNGNSLFAGTMDTGELYKVDLSNNRVAEVATTLGKVYGLLVSPDNETLYVSDWLRSRVLVYNATDLSRRGSIPVGPHPTEMALGKDGRLWVTCAADATVYAIDPKAMRVTESVKVSVHPNAPEGSAPASLALTSDGKKLYVAVADNNCVACVDVSKPGHARLEGFIPTGWYTSAVRVSPDGKKIMSVASKGSTAKSNADKSYIGRILKGQIYFTDTPSPAVLAQMTQQVIANSPYRDELLKAAVNRDGSLLPNRPGDKSPIKYVIYIIKENRTFDQVLGDMPNCEADTSLCIFGDKITPNQHKLSRDFVLLDNFYVDAEVSADGHNWSTAAYANDYVEKAWPYNYGGHGGSYDFEGENPLSRPVAGYLWDTVNRAGLTYRSYGEFLAEEEDDPNTPNDGVVAGLKGHVSPDYPGWDTSISDMTRFNIWIKEFRGFEQKGEMPRLQIVRFPQDHTSGTSPGAWTPNAMVADNDLAVGKLVGAVSHSKFWKETAIFILEDDAQGGPDHVDAHRSTCYVASPYTRFGATDSNFYTTCSVIRTIELLLGAQPLNQYDAAARPMYSLFRGRPNLTPFDAVVNQVPIDERNPKQAVMAAESLSLNFKQCDAIDDMTLNRILWAAAKGPNTPYPTVNHTSAGLFR